MTKCHLALARRRLADQAKQGGSEVERGSQQMRLFTPDKLMLLKRREEQPVWPSDSYVSGALPCSLRTTSDTFFFPYFFPTDTKFCVCEKSANKPMVPYKR